MTPLPTNIPYGYCHCGCGQKTTPCRQNQTGRPTKKGEPNLFISRHHIRACRVAEDAVPFKIDGVYCRLIPLQEGFFTIVDATDYAHLMQWSWYARKCEYSYYVAGAARNGSDDKILLHRKLLGLGKGNFLEGDHANRNGLDNRRNNIRPATPTENKQNQRKPIVNTSGYKGVRLRCDGKKWIACIKVNGKPVHLGSFNSAEEAYSAYCEAAWRYHGEFARVA